MPFPNWIIDPPSFPLPVRALRSLAVTAIPPLFSLFHGSRAVRTQALRKAEESRMATSSKFPFVVYTLGGLESWLLVLDDFTFFSLSSLFYFTLFSFSLPFDTIPLHSRRYSTQLGVHLSTTFFWNYTHVHYVAWSNKKNNYKRAIPSLCCVSRFVPTRPQAITYLCAPTSIGST